MSRPVSGRARGAPASTQDQEESDDYDAVRRQERLPRRIPSARARERQREREAFLEEQERVGVRFMCYLLLYGSSVIILFRWERPIIDPSIET